VLAAAPQGPGSVLVAARDERGTNAALRCPPSLFPLQFGDYSFEPHRRAARATAKPCVVLRLPGIELDVDTPADLALIVAGEARTRTQALLENWNVRQRLQGRSQKAEIRKQKTEMEIRNSKVEIRKKASF
jgi:2-phospho-L-lactate/phosphoenolpyruvate guanylyltransferase